MEAFRDQFTTTELLSYKEVLYDEATEEWYAQRDPDEVEREEHNCMRLARQFGREIMHRTKQGVIVKLVYLKQCKL